MIVRTFLSSPSPNVRFRMHSKHSLPLSDGAYILNGHYTLISQFISITQKQTKNFFYKFEAQLHFKMSHLT